MKYIALAIILLVAITGNSYAQQTPIVYTGVQYDTDKGLTYNVGSAQQLTGGLYLMEHADIGTFGTLNTNLAYFFKPKQNVYVGIVAGPGAEFTGSEEPVTYITGGSGLIVNYWFNAVIGGYFAGRYNFALDENANFYQDGASYYAGLTINFGY